MKQYIALTAIIIINMSYTMEEERKPLLPKSKADSCIRPGNTGTLGKTLNNLLNGFLGEDDVHDRIRYDVIGSCDDCSASIDLNSTALNENTEALNRNNTLKRNRLELKRENRKKREREEAIRQEAKTKRAEILKEHREKKEQLEKEKHRETIKFIQGIIHDQEEYDEKFDTIDERVDVLSKWNAEIDKASSYMGAKVNKIDKEVKILKEKDQGRYTDMLLQWCDAIDQSWFDLSIRLDGMTEDSERSVTDLQAKVEEIIAEIATLQRMLVYKRAGESKEEANERRIAALEEKERGHDADDNALWQWASAFEASRDVDREHINVVSRGVEKAYEAGFNAYIRLNEKDKEIQELKEQVKRLPELESMVQTVCLLLSEQQPEQKKLLSRLFGSRKQQEQISPK